MCAPPQTSQFSLPLFYCFMKNTFLFYCERIQLYSKIGTLLSCRTQFLNSVNILLADDLPVSPAAVAHSMSGCLSKNAVDSCALFFETTLFTYSFIFSQECIMSVILWCVFSFPHLKKNGWGWGDDSWANVCCAGLCAWVQIPSSPVKAGHDSECP